MELSRETLSRVSPFQFPKDSQDDMLTELRFSLDMSQKYVLPILDKVNTLTESINFFDNYAGSICTNHYNAEHRFDLCPEYEEGMLYVKTDDQELKERLKCNIENEELEKRVRERAAIIYSYFADPKVNKLALEELEKRKALNIEILRSYGLDV